MRIKLDIPLKLSEICRYMKGKMLISENPVITHICTDTREIRPKDLFIAIKGETFDGEDFTECAANKGSYIVGKYESSAHVQLSDTRAALLSFAREYKKMLSLKKTVAITGSVGKTTTKELLYHIVSSQYVTHKTLENHNNELGVPYTILSAPKNCEILIIESGMNHPGELSVLSECIEPDIAIITAIGTAHIGNFGSREMIAKSKLEITDHMKSNGTTLVPYEEKLLNQAPNRLSVSLSNRNADFFFEKKENEYVLHYKDETISSSIPALIGDHIPKCLSYAISTATLIGVTKEKIINSVSKIPGSSSRGALLKIGPFNVYDDSYNSSPEAVISAFSTLKGMNFKNKSALLGDMNELGRETEALHREIGRQAAIFGLKNLFLYGVYSEFVACGAIDAGFDKNRIFKNTDTTNPEITAQQIKNVCKEDEIILFKASHKLNLGKIIKLLEKDCDKP